MRKFVGCLILVVAISFIFTNVSFSASKVVESPTLKTFVSGKQVKLNSAPIIVNGEILLDAKEFLVKLGLQNDSKHIQLDKNKKNLEIYNGKLQIKMTINSTKATVGKSSVSLNFAPILYKNKYYIPVKSTVQLLDMKFAWDDEEKSIYIQKLENYNKVKAFLDKAIAATSAINKYAVEDTYNTTDNYKDTTDVSKHVTVSKVDKKKMIMTINSDYDDSISGPSTSQHYLYNNFLYTKYSFKEKWEKELLSKKDYEEWILNYDVSKFKISDILYCGLAIQENLNNNTVILKGNVYLHVNKKEYEFEPVDTYLEISINKSNNLINKITHIYSEYGNSSYSGRYLYSSTETLVYKDFNSDFNIEVPDEGKMEFKDTIDDANTAVTPITLSDDEEAKIEILSSNIVKVPVDGAWKHPYELDVTQAIMFIILNNKNDLNTFTNLSDDAKKIFINEIVQDNYGDYIGCETVFGMVVYDSKTYADIITGYDTAPENITLEKYDEGFEVTVVTQDKKNNTYSNYEGK